MRGIKSAEAHSDSKKHNKHAEYDIEKRLFNALDYGNKGYFYKKQFIEVLNKAGLDQHHLSLQPAFKKLTLLNDGSRIHFEQFVELTKDCLSLVEKALTGGFIIPAFPEFCKQIDDIFEKTKSINTGEVASYIPQLARVDPNLFSVCICTVDGQLYNLGDFNTSFTVQSICKAVNYCLIQEEHGEEFVHQWIGKEPSGHSFNGIRLNKYNMPHNPFINAGGIVACSLMRSDLDIADKFDYVTEIWRDLCGDIKPGFNNAVYLSEKSTGHKNFAIAHFLKEKKAFLDETNIDEIIEFYFQCCSIEVTPFSMSILAGTLANAGICPLTQKKIFSPQTIKNCLSLLSTCGLYDFSGEFAFSVGLPAKSGVSGVIFLVIPDVMGICIFSPLLDEFGNSVKGVAFSKFLVDKFNFHNFDSVVRNTNKMDPRCLKNESKLSDVMSLIWAASLGDINEIKRLIALGVDLNESDYDKRTALHLAAAEGQTHVINYLLNKGANINSLDRWEQTPLDNAKSAGHLDAVNALLQHEDYHKKEEPICQIILTNNNLEIFNEYNVHDNNYDEYFIAKNTLRPEISFLTEALKNVSLDNFKSTHQKVKELFSKDGITFKVHGDDKAQPFPFDLLPRIVQNNEWKKTEKGLQQRIYAINLFLDDIYDQQKILKNDKKLREYVLSCQEYVASLRDITPLGKTRVHIAGCDLIRNVDGNLYVLEDNLKVPSGVSYLLENRKVMQELVPGWMENFSIEAVDQYPEKLRTFLCSLTPKNDPLLVILTPGPYNSAYFEHQYLASRMDCPLVENRDLWVDENKVYWNSPIGKQQVDIVYKRTNDEFLDPQFFRPDSLLGVPGIVKAYRAGNVILANALGNGVGDDKAIYSFIPRIIEYYTGEKPILPQIKTYLAADKKDLNFILSHLNELVIKEVNKSGGFGMLIGPQASLADLKEFKEKIKAAPRSYIAQPLIELSSIPALSGEVLRPHRVDFRTYILSADSNVWVLPGGLTRVALRDNSYIVNSCQGGGSKDTWICKAKV